MNSYHLKTYEVGPPGGWRYYQVETQYWMSGITFQDLLKKVSMHRANNNLPNTNTLIEVEAQICERMEPADQITYCDLGLKQVASIHWTQVLRFLQDLVAWAGQGFAVVPQEEAERRALICTTCPLNVGTHGCGSCRSALEAVRSGVMKVETSQDAKLQACGVCGCELKTAVHVPLDVLKKGQTGLTFPDWCWQKES